MLLPLTKNIIKSIRQLEMRKHRKAERLFLVEGSKSVCDILTSLRCHRLIATPEWLQTHPEAETCAEECFCVTRSEMERVSLLTTPQEVVATFHTPTHTFDPDRLRSSLTLALDDVQDPGNVGTIIRLCDWFGIREIVCSSGTADCYSPKAVQASMGAIGRVRVHHMEIRPFVTVMKGLGVPVYGTFLSGDNIYRSDLPTDGAVIVMGNEGNGISPAVESEVTHRLTIPSFATADGGSESLNVSIAAAITVSEFRRHHPPQP